MRIWDTELLKKSAGIVQKVSITTTSRKTDSLDIYNSYFVSYLSTGVVFLHAVVSNNESHTNALQTVNAYKGAINAQTAFNETSRTIAPQSGYEAILSAGAKIDIYYIQASSFRGLINIGAPVVTYVDTAAAAYTLSSNIYNDFAAAHTPTASAWVVLTFPETAQSVNQYLYVMECRKLNGLTQVNQFKRYGASQTYAVSASYACKINSGANVVTIAVNLNDLGAKK